MILISTIINTFKQNFLEQYKGSILPSHQKALWAMKECRQAHGPHMLEQCTNHDCGKRRYIPHSWGHRSCPHCQNHESQQWIENQLFMSCPHAWCKYQQVGRVMVEKTGYLFNERALAKVFRAKMLESLVHQGLNLTRDCPENWIAHCKNIGNKEVLPNPTSRHHQV